jgi:hypothetical protein
MILEQSEADDRLNSADNLVNRLRNSRIQPSADRNSQPVWGEKNRSSISDTPFGIKREPSRAESMSIFGVEKQSSSVHNPVLPPSPEELIQDLESKLKLGLAHDAAVEVMYDSVEMLRKNLVNMDPSHPERLAKVAFEMGRIVSTIDEVRSGSKHMNAPTIIYKPVMLNETHYEVVNVHE